MNQDMLLQTTLGIVRATDDPLQMGRVRVFCPAIDREEYKVDELPWAWYCPPLGGNVQNMSRGAPIAGAKDPAMVSGGMAYGMWGVPKVGSQVVVWFLGGDPSWRMFSCMLMQSQTNRSLPAGRNYHIDSGAPGPWSDTYAPMEPGYSNVRQAGLGDADWYYTRGGYERQVAQASTNKTGKEGYAEDPSKKDGTLDPQTYAWVSPGGHYITLQDAPEFCRVRIKSTHGHQVLLDDTNERIYISTAKGASWIEMDQDGHIHIHADESISINTEKDFNVNAEGFINMNAEKGVNIKSPKSLICDFGEDIHLAAGKSAYIGAGKDFHLNAGGSVYETAGSQMHLNGGGKLIESAGQIHLNGPSATKAASAKTTKKPPIIPKHEPWEKRPGVNVETNHGIRNRYWKK